MLLLLSLLLKAPAHMVMLDLQRHIPAADTNVGPTAPVMWERRVEHLHTPLRVGRKLWAGDG